MMGGLEKEMGKGNKGEEKGRVGETEEGERGGGEERKSGRK